MMPADLGFRDFPPGQNIIAEPPKAEIELPFMDLVREAMRQHAAILEMHAELFKMACCFRITVKPNDEKGTA